MLQDDNDMDRQSVHPGTEGGAAGKPAIIETASATTDPDNANSGNAAYAIAAIVVVVLLVIGSSLGSFLSTALSYLASNDGYYEQEWDYYGEPKGQDLDGEMIDTWSQNSGSLGGSSQDVPATHVGGIRPAMG